jgi:hypothetical protein
VDDVCKIFDDGLSHQKEIVFENDVDVPEYKKEVFDVDNYGSQLTKNPDAYEAANKIYKNLDKIKN